MVLWIKSRLSLKFWMAEADISRDIFCDTVDTIPPKMEKNKMIRKSKERYLVFPCLFGFVSIGTSSFHAVLGPIWSYGKYRRCRKARGGLWYGIL